MFASKPVHGNGRDKKSLRTIGIQAKVTPFIVDMAELMRMRINHCRAGATSLAEITAAGKAAIFDSVPLAANDHQLKNAQALASEGPVVISEKESLAASY